MTNPTNTPKAADLPAITTDRVVKMNNGVLAYATTTTHIGSLAIDRLAWSDGDKDIHVQNHRTDIVTVRDIPTHNKIVVNTVDQRTRTTPRTEVNTYMGYAEARALRDRLNALDLGDA